jgi:hypothetical protein
MIRPFFLSFSLKSFSKHVFLLTYIMKALRILVMLSAVAGGVALSSCGCCTGEEKPAKLRPLPHFNDVPTPVEYAK